MAEGKKPVLHRDGIFGVADHVPTGVIAALGENRVAAGDVFFGVNRVDFVFDFAAFRRDGEETDTVN